MNTSNTILLSANPTETLTADHLSHADGAPRPSVYWISIADENLVFKEVEVSSFNLTGEQILQAAAKELLPDSVVLQLMPTGEIENIRRDEAANLTLSSKFLIARSDRSYHLFLDGTRTEWPFRHISGRAIRTVGRVGVERDVIFTASNSTPVVISDTDLIDLDSPGSEVFTTKVRTWKLRVQAVTMDFAEHLVTVGDAMKRAGFDPTKAWHIFLLISGEPKQEVTVNTIVDLRTPGIEKIRLMQRNVDNGDGARENQIVEFALQDVDTKYLDESKFRWEAIVDQEKRWLVIHDYRLGDRFVPESVTLALDIPKEYPAAQIDMFYFSPAVARADGVCIPSTQVTAAIKNVQFQGWSRHRNGDASWDPATDNVSTHLVLVESCLDREFGE